MISNSVGMTLPISEEIDAMIDDLSVFTEIRIDLLEDMMWGKS